MFMMVQEELGQASIGLANNRISLFLKYHINQIKTSYDLQIIILVLAIIFLEEIILKISALRKL
jgi:hypothetical protein